MKKLVLFLALWSGINFCSHAYTLIPDTINKKPIPINTIIKKQTIDFTTTISGTYSIMIESNGNVIDISEVNLSANEVYSIDMSTLPAGAYRVVITDIIRGIEYEYFYRKEDNTEMI